MHYCSGAPLSNHLPNGSLPLPPQRYDWDHKESLLSEANARRAAQTFRNLRLSCNVAGNCELQARPLAMSFIARLGVGPSRGWMGASGPGWVPAFPGWASAVQGGR